MLKDFSNDFGILDSCNDFHFAAALGAGLHVNVEDSGQKPCPGNVFLLWLQLWGLGSRWILRNELEFRRLRNDLFSVFIVRTKDSMVPGEMHPGFWDECYEPLHQLHGCELHGGCAIIPWFFELIDHLAQGIGG